jgi:hypothetical protein
VAHRIRLHGPWDVTPANPEVPAGRMTIPGTLRDGGWQGFSGRVVFHRRFGRPTNLETDERVWLFFEKVVGPSHVWLNDELLRVTEGTARFDVTAALATRNALRVDMNACDDQCGLLGEVALEITKSETKD